MVASLGSFHRKGGPDVPVLDGGTGASAAAAALSNLGHGSANHDGISGVGKLVQRNVTVRTASISQAAPGIPVDNSLPTNTEGGVLDSVSLTPLAGSRLRVRFGCFGAATVAGQWTVALFLNAEGTARAVSTISTGVNSPDYNGLFYEMAALGASSHTFTIRFGHAGGSAIEIGGTGAGNLFAGAEKAYLSVEEIRP